ncbi:MAG TPA: DNA topoisomerase I [Nitrososphaeraceae archaeon]|nr:DNA topoisomerase I [Nitrososphaeraceae archaeon]
MPGEFHRFGTEHYKLVICEKPLAAKRISEVLGSKKMTERELASGVVIFEIISDKNQRFIVCSALGHLYSLFPIERNRKKYPIFEAKWSPRHSAIVREKRRILEILKVISKISEGASGFIHACDYDLEGELIGYNILEYACNHKYELSMRAKFSSLTNSEINQSFNNLQEPNIRIAEAGKARHLVDFIFGINLSRALVNCLSVSNQNNRYYNLSIGRVQGPTLGFMVDRELKIRNHVPDPVWNVNGKFEKDGSFFKANLITSVHKFSEIQKILSTCRNEKGTIKKINRLDKKLNPPTPFNISNLQKEAFRIFNMPPAATLSVAESLYLSALISYPRTSSQKLPSSIGYKKILERLSMNYPTRNKNFVQKLSKLNHLVPYQGNEEDPAHPAIYPTGVKHKKLNAQQHKILDLIIKRFLSTFGTTAVTKYIEVTINVNGHDFMAKGNTILNYGWIPIYEPYFSINEFNLPELRMGESIEVNEVTAMEDYTKPPARYNQATLLDKMESQGIGTKSTRADIINLLIKRKYITQDKIGLEPTELGFTILNTMKKFIPEIVSTKLSTFLESSIKRIEDGDLEMIDIRKYLEKSLEIALNKIKKNELAIGDEIKNGLNESENGTSIGKCPKCHIGEMILIKSRKSDKRFIACSAYRVTGCKAIAPVPQEGNIKGSNSICSCGWPILSIIFNRKKIWTICVNRVCPDNRFNKTDSHHKSDLNTSI